MTLHEAIFDFHRMLSSFDPLTLLVLGWLAGSIMTLIAAWIVIT